MQTLLNIISDTILTLAYQILLFHALDQFNWEVPDVLKVIVLNNDHLPFCNFFYEISVYK